MLLSAPVPRVFPPLHRGYGAGVPFELRTVRVSWIVMKFPSRIETFISSLKQ
jgi:hypothetical protein